MESNLDVVMVGPEGAGKTVLAAVLVDYVVSNPDLGLKIRFADYETTKYRQDVMSTLQRGEWPKSTRPGDVHSLSWQWAVSDVWHRAFLQDHAGQDIRDELTGESSRLDIATQTRDATLLILVVDIWGHQLATEEERQQNGWIVEHVLQLIDPEITNLIIVVTKVDRLGEELPADQIANKAAVLRVISNGMPEANLGSYRQILDHPGCAAVAVAAVAAQVDYVEGAQVTVPSHDLRQIGLANLVQEISRAICRTDERRRGSIKGDGTRNPGGMRRWTVPAAVLLCVMMALWLSLSRCGGERFESKCPVCDGKGSYTDVPFTTTRCKACEGGGSISSRPDHYPDKCEECGGDGSNMGWPCEDCRGTGILWKKIPPR